MTHIPNITDDGLYPDADEPWLPTLLDVERMKASEPDGSPIDWRRFGWSALEVPPTATHVVARFDILGQRFLERYAYRMLGQETMEKWQTRLQNRMDEVVEMYERAYALYESNQKALMEDVVPGRSVTTDTSLESDTNDASNGESRASATPDQLINDSDDYAGSISKNKNNRTGKRNDKGTVNTKEVWQGAQVIQAVNDSIDGWRNIDTAFIASFENVFLNIWWY